jgi:aryl-alcohol dehydrogenase-like predicted oxidoreductase
VAERVRIEVGFDSGQVMAALVANESADSLEQALETGHEGAFQLDVEDGRYTLVLRRVVYVKRFAREARVGFGA